LEANMKLSFSQSPKYKTQSTMNLLGKFKENKS